MQTYAPPRKPSFSERVGRMVSKYTTFFRQNPLSATVYVGSEFIPFGGSFVRELVGEPQNEREKHALALHGVSAFKLMQSVARSQSYRSKASNFLNVYNSNAPRENRLENRPGQPGPVFANSRAREIRVHLQRYRPIVLARATPGRPSVRNARKRLYGNFSPKEWPGRIARAKAFIGSRT